MKEAIRLLNEPDLDGDRILLLVQETTIVTGEDRVQKKTSIFFDKGSTCSMVTKALVQRLNLQSLKKTLIVQSFRHTEAIDTEYVVLEPLKTDDCASNLVPGMQYAKEISCSRRTAKLQNQADGQPISVGRQHGGLHSKLQEVYNIYICR